MKNIIFIGGIHGVGKTFLCEKISKKYNINSFSASKLISNIIKTDYSVNKNVEDINKNQDVLIRAISELNLENETILLEGHFCLLDKNGLITRVPVSTFMSLGIKAIIIIASPVEIVYSRLEKRGSTFRSLNFLKNFSKEEMEYSYEISKKLEIPYFIYDETKSKINDLNDFLRLKVNN